MTMTTHTRLETPTSHETSDGGDLPPDLAALSTERQVEQYATGAVRDRRDGKGRYDLLSPIAMRRVAQLLERGADHYGDRNWEKGMPLTRFFDSGVRHAYQWLEGERDEDHLAAAVWNFMCIMHGEEMIERRVWPADMADQPSFVERMQRGDAHSNGIQNDHIPAQRAKERTMSDIRRGTVAICSRGHLGLITSNAPREVTYPNGSKGTAWVGIHLGDDDMGQPWSSRTPKPIGLLDAMIQRAIDD